MRRWTRVAADLRRPFVAGEVGQLLQRDLAAGRIGDFDLPQPLEVALSNKARTAPAAATALSFEDLAHHVAAHRRHRVEHVAGVDAVAGDPLPLDLHAQIRQPADLLGLHVGGARARG